MSGFVVKMSGEKPGDDFGGGGDEKMDMAKVLANPHLLSQLTAMDEEQLRAQMFQLPPGVQKRLKALKKLQLDSMELEAEFYRQVHAMELQFQPRFAALHAKRRDYVTGTAEPSDADADFPLIGGKASLEKELEEKVKLENGDHKAPENEPTGIPEFWLSVFKNADIIADMIQECDEPILAKLTDVECAVSEGTPMTFTLTFTFAPNEFFSNTTLTKTYTLKCEIDENEPFEFDGPEIVACTGTRIEWKSKEKNVTVKQIKKKQKHKKQGNTRFVTKEVKSDSFFNFFDPPAHSPDTDFDELDDDTREILNADFEIGQVLRDRIIPRAVLYFTGEAQDDDEDFEDEDEDMDDEDEDEDDDGESGDEEVAKNMGAKKH